MRNRTLIALLTCSALLAFYALGSRPLSLAYHRWQFDIANEYMINGPSNVDSNGMLVTDITTVAPRHEYHMKKLVELGAIAKIEFPMTNITNDSPGRSLFLKKLLAGRCPRVLYWSSTEHSDSNPMVLDVWCELTDRENWTEFLQRENKHAGETPEQRVADEALEQPL